MLPLCRADEPLLDVEEANEEEEADTVVNELAGIAAKLPSVEEMISRIKATDGAALLSDAKTSLDVDVIAKLDRLAASWQNVDHAKVAAALRACNDSNAASTTPRFRSPIQRHAAGDAACILVDGTYPTTSTMFANCTETLSCMTSPTVINISLLEGHQPDHFPAESCRANRMPTTLPTYTEVPTQADFAIFQHSHIQLLSALFSAGVQVYDAVSDTCRKDAEQAIHGAATPTFIVLVEKNGATLELHMPAGKPVVLTTFPAEHLSHMSWQAMKEVTRLWQLEGLASVYAARSALLGSAPPKVEKLLEVIGGAPFKGWYRGGAYCEAVMKTTRLMQFTALYGSVDGKKRWQDWYTDCKVRAGRLGGVATRGHRPGQGDSSALFCDVELGGFTFFHVPMTPSNSLLQIGQSHVPAERKEALIRSQILRRNDDGQHRLGRRLNPLGVQAVTDVRWRSIPGCQNGQPPSGAEVYGPRVVTRSMDKGGCSPGGVHTGAAAFSRTQSTFTRI